MCTGRSPTLLRDLPAAAPPELRRLGLAAALQRVVEDELRPAFDEVSWQATPQAVQAANELQPMQAEVAYYAAREVVRNAARHARPAGSNLPLRLETRLNWNEGLEIVIQDNGVGLEHANANSGGQRAGPGAAQHAAGGDRRLAFSRERTGNVYARADPSAGRGNSLTDRLLIPIYSN